MEWLVRKIVRNIVRMIVLFIAGAVVLSLVAVLLSLVTMLLWNALIPALFNGPSVTFGQALGLLILSHILFRGASPWRRGGGWDRERWRRRFEEKLQAMTPEERERFEQKWGRRWCSPPAPASEQKPTSEQKPAP